MASLRQKRPSVAQIRVTRAKILYVQPGIGMGMVFVETAEDQLKILEKWLVDLPPAITA